MILMISGVTVTSTQYESRPFGGMDISHTDKKTNANEFVNCHAPTKQYVSCDMVTDGEVIQRQPSGGTKNLQHEHKV